jgi:putative transposase
MTTKHDTNNRAQKSTRREEPLPRTVQNLPLALNGGRAEGGDYSAKESGIALASSQQATRTNDPSLAERECPPRADEFSDKALADFGKKYQLVCLVEAGRSPRESLDHLGIKGSESWVRKLCKRFKAQGIVGLLDRRSQNGSNRRLLTKEVEELTLALWYARPAAGAHAIWKELKKICAELGCTCPKYDVIKKFLKNRPAHDKLVREGKIRVWDKQARPVVRFNITSYANERWQVDHTRLDIWVRVKLGDRWQPAQVYLSVALDAHSRAIAGIWLSTRYPDAWTVALLLRQAILPKSHPGWKNRGIPNFFQCDRGKDFMSNAILLALGYLGISRDPDPPHYPNRKGKIERWFLTLNRGCLVMLPGHMEAVGKSEGAAAKHVAELLELADLRKEIVSYIVESYHQRTHSETGRKPAEFWEETVLLREPESEDALNILLLKSDETRTVNGYGIQLTINNTTGDYWAPPLVEYSGQQVQVRYNPDDCRSVLAYSADTGEFICEASLMGQPDSQYTIEDVNRVRKQYRQGLVARMSDYVKKAEEFDRPRKEAARRKKAHQVAQEQATKRGKSDGSKRTDKLGAAKALLAKVERRLRS